MIDLNQLPYRTWLESLSPTNQHHIAAYLTLQQARRRAPSTLEQSLTTLKSFYTLVPSQTQARLALDLCHVVSTDIDEWLDAATTHGLAATTRASRLRILRHFFEFLKQQGLMTRQPVLSRRHHIHVPQHLPRPMTDTDVVAFFHVIDKLRDRLFFLVMLRCGLRSSEVRHLMWTAINWEQQTLRIDDSKGAVDRIVYFSPDVETDLQQWQRTTKYDSPYVFPSPMKAYEGQPLSRFRAHTLFAHYIAKAGLNPDYTSHCLRHTFATNLLNAGASLEVLKELMGHTSLDMTLRYVKLYDATKRQQYDEAMAHAEQRYSLKRR